MRSYTGTGYPHNNLNREQREALDRLRAPRFEFRRYWQGVTLTDPDGKGVHFFPRVRRTWAFCVRGYVVVQFSGRLQKTRPLPPAWPLPQPSRARQFADRLKAAAGGR